MPIPKYSAEVFQNYGSVEYLDTGTDSRVYALVNPDGTTNSAFKDYEKLEKKLHERTKDVLRQYYVDTEAAAEVLKENPNPLNQTIEAGGESYELSYRIVPQGKLIFEGAEKQPIVVGQKFVSGANLANLEFYDYADSAREEHPVAGQDLFRSNAEVCAKIKLATDDLVNSLAKKLDTYFHCASLNIKPIQNSEHSIEVIITDLVGSLERYYELSSKFAELRNSEK